MKVIEVVSVAIRIFGLLLFVVTLRDAPQLLAAIADLGLEANTPSVYIQWGMVASCILASAFMMKFPGVISRLLVTPSNSSSPLLEENGQAIQIAGITIVGVYILTWAIPDFLYNGLILWVVSGYETPPKEYISETKLREFVTVIEIAIGLYLALGAKGLTTVLNKLRA
ncbi:hypothetical protein [Shewanella khirikhana]|uniref:Tripartite ATP-independent periplasmic transporter, DctQ component n=1 Tax=Shewanella khirikhana TaxID=1965282 RepID=A0ABM7D105_9GAMM|nr:hypothetical protein [Shewanella khirikhana]AZQ10049.1 hypothetical protein STH12_00913 [Shewanella khirikhana]